MRATIISIPKQGKDPLKLNSYIFIELLSSISKVYKKLILFELKKYISKNIWPEQAALWQKTLHYSITALTQPRFLLMTRRLLMVFNTMRRPHIQNINYKYQNPFNTNIFYSIASFKTTCIKQQFESWYFHQ